MMVLRMKNFNIFVVHWKIQLLVVVVVVVVMEGGVAGVGGSPKTNIVERGLDSLPI